MSLELADHDFGQCKDTVDNEDQEQELSSDPVKQEEMEEDYDESMDDQNVGEDEGPSKPKTRSALTKTVPREEGQLDSDIKDPQMLQSEDEDEEFESQNLLEPQVDLIEGDGEFGQKKSSNVRSSNRDKSGGILESRLKGSVKNGFGNSKNFDEDDYDDYFPTGPDERRGCRSLVCDSNGIIIAEMVYRCMICSFVSDSISKAQAHYHKRHMKDTPLPPKNSSVPDHQDELDASLDDQEDDDFPSDEALAEFGMNQSTDFGSSPGMGGGDGLGGSKKTGNFVFSPSPADYVPGRNATRAAAAAAPASNSNTVRGGYVTCAVCNITKYYASVQRRYGQFTCMGCAKFFGRFLIKPRRYFCPRLGECPLDTSPRCKACLLQACINTYNIDDKRKRIVNSCLPLKSKVTPTSARPIQPATSRPPNVVLSNVQNTPTSSSSISMAKTIPIGSIPSSTTVTLRPGASTTPIILKYALPANLPPNAPARGSLLIPSKNGNQTSTSSSPSGSTAGLSVSLVSSGRKGLGCKQCANCLADDCGKCNYCMDKPKFGGPNTLKKKCIQKKCLLQPPQGSVKLKISRK